LGIEVESLLRLTVYVIRRYGNILAKSILVVKLHRKQQKQRSNIMTEQTKLGVYGYCPVCGGFGLARERRINGNDKCVNGHTYPSKDAVKLTNMIQPTSEYEALKAELKQKDELIAELSKGLKRISDAQKSWDIKVALSTVGMANVADETLAKVKAIKENA
jgi:DNA repair exonuclease SbcCD ATPase subunit